MLSRIATTIVGTLAFITGVACSQSAPQTPELAARWKDATMYDLKVKTLEGKDANLSDYAGKVTIVVNVASQCGFTRQYAGLQKLYDTYKDRGLVILAFPSGDFGGQEFDDPKEIREFCTTKYSVTFPVFEKARQQGAHRRDREGARREARQHGVRHRHREGSRQEVKRKDD